MQAGNITYRATAGTDVVVAVGPVMLHRILIGKDVASSVVEVSDSATDGDGNVKVYAEGSTLMTANGGVIEVGAVFSKGIAADITQQTNVSFIWSPLS